MKDIKVRADNKKDYVQPKMDVITLNACSALLVDSGNIHEMGFLDSLEDRREV